MSGEQEPVAEAARKSLRASETHPETPPSECDILHSVEHRSAEFTQFSSPQQYAQTPRVANVAVRPVLRRTPAPGQGTLGHTDSHRLN